MRRKLSELADLLDQYDYPLLAHELASIAEFGDNRKIEFLYRILKEFKG